MFAGFRRKNVNGELAEKSDVRVHPVDLGGGHRSVDSSVLRLVLCHLRKLH
jgi:hypothetical protein